MNINQNTNFKPHNTSVRLGKIEYIIIHYVGATGDAKANINYYNQPTTTNASADFYVGFAGDIWQYNPDPVARYCWAVGGKKLSGGGGSFYGIAKNTNCVSIEMCVRNYGSKASTSKDWYFEDATVEATIELTKYLMKLYNIPASRVIRHYDVTGKLCLPTDTTELLTKQGWVYLKDLAIGDTIAQYNSDKDIIEFKEISDKVSPYQGKVLSCRNLEATGNHNMYVIPNSRNSHKFRNEKWEDVLSGSKQYLVKNGARYIGRGLALSDDELRLLAWVQGDGHYMHLNDKIYGVEFHLKKKRKIEVIKELLKNLNIEYTICNKSDGSVSIRNHGEDLYEWCERWLDDKKFDYNLLEMSEHQFEVFWNELLIIDGNVEKNLYSSSVQQNLDVVQAICSTKGIRTNKCTIGTKEPSALIRTESNYSIGGIKKKVSMRNTEVSCVTVSSGYILIRQNGKTFIVGNCPNPYVYNHTKYTWEDFKAALVSKPVVKSKEGWTFEEGEWKFYLDNDRCIKNDWYLYNGKWCWFDESGSAIHDTWLEYKGNWYYFDSDCYMKSSEWTFYKDKWYYLKSDGIMAKNSYVKSQEPNNNNYYYLNENGEFDESKTVQLATGDIVI